MQRENSDRDFVKANYESMGGYKIAEILGISYHSVVNYAVRLGINHNRIFPPNLNKKEDYFRIWNYDMAYILGFTISDGYILDNDRSYALTYGINTKDLEILEFIQSQISPDSKIRSYKTFDKRTNKYYDRSQLSIYSKVIVKSLEDLGLIQAKTGKEVLPDIPEQFRMSFLCGFFDGDGHLRACKKNGYLFEFTCMSESFLNDLKDKICGGLGKVQPDRGWFKYIIGRKAVCQDLDAKMIANVSFYLKRKHFPKDSQIEQMPKIRKTYIKQSKQEYQIIGTI